MNSTKIETKATTPAKATTVKRITINAHAQKSLGITVVTESGMREAWSAAQQQRAVVAFDAYVLSVGLLSGSKPVQGKDIAIMLGTTPGNVSALIRAGAILNRAGAHAARIGSDAVTLCQNSNAGQTAPLDALTGKVLADSVVRMAKAALAGKSGKGTRAPQPATPKATPKATPSTDTERAAQAATCLRAVKSDALATASDADAKAIALAVQSARTECDRILAALTARPTPKATPATVAKATPKATPKA